MENAVQRRTNRIRRLNDILRKLGLGGRIQITAGLNQYGPDIVAEVLKAVASFSDFNADNDPYGEHDCAVQQVGKLKIVWKIDYYDLDMAHHSLDPADEKVTTRVMTIMLAEEY